MPVPAEILKLVQRFAEQHDEYVSGTYNETQLRRDFVDPFLKALGWDVDNQAGNAEQYREVVHEDKVLVGGESKAPDYSCRIGGVRKFFIEAKKPGVDLKNDSKPAFQLRRYGWSAKLPVSLLTNFEEFAVYDTRLRPSEKDKAASARVLYLTYREYADRWDEIAEAFSKDAVLKGSFDKYVDGKKGRRGTATVDDAFLEEIEGWRELLARDLARENPKLEADELNFAVQRILDRIIFLRICEDRRIEDYGQLGGLVNGPHVYGRLKELFDKADRRYNSGLFHFREEKDRHESPDTVTPRLKIGDKTLKEIINGLYYPAPWVFDVIPADILGHIYEQFLGKTIRLTAGHNVKVEEKPEVRKAGGVYYTPTYIVDYIVKETVGKLLEGKTPKEAAEIKILDPACGSGSFLIGAYQCLLDWHLSRYLTDPEKHKKQLYKANDGALRLSTAERKRILLNSIYGVDLDPQAVEVTKLSLLLKVLEGETGEALQYSLQAFHERVLPDLGDNIKRGNSLVTPDFFAASLFESEAAADPAVRPFGWSIEFPSVMKRQPPGFDAIVGNPPYIPMELLSSAEKQFFQRRHPELSRKYDSAAVFYLVSADLLSSRGVAGFISSVTWQTGENYKGFRRTLFHKYGVRAIVNLPYDVFGDAYVDTGVVVFQKKESPTVALYRFPKKSAISTLAGMDFQQIPVSEIAAPDFRLVLDPVATQVLRRVQAEPQFTTLGAITESTQGFAGNMYDPTRLRSGTMKYLVRGQVHRYRLKVEEVAAVSMVGKESVVKFYEARPKFLIRRVISRDDRVLCTFSTDEMVFRKDINPFLLIDPTVEAFAMLAILNSRVCSYLYVNSSSIAMKDDFRQTTLAELRALPVPRVTAGATWGSELGKLGKQMLAIGARLQDRAEDSPEWLALDAEIERRVAQLYGLNAAELAASNIRSEG